MTRGRGVRTALVLAVAALALGACGTLRGKAKAPAAPLAEATPPPPAPAPPLIRPPPPAPPAPVRTSCVPRNMPRPPKYPDSDQALRDAGGAADRYQLMAAGRLLRIQRLAEVEKILEGCR